jgi:putative copper resistance protein D
MGPSDDLPEGGLYVRFLASRPTCHECVQPRRFPASFVIPLILVWLRAAGLVGQVVTLGGAALCLAVSRRGRAGDSDRTLDLTLAFAAFGAVVAAVAQAGTLAALAAQLADGRGWPVAALLGSTVGLSGLIRIACSLITVGVALRLRRVPDSITWRVVFLTTAGLLSVTGTLATHAVGWVGSSLWTAALSVLHQAAAGVWVGGLMCAAALGLRGGAAPAEAWLRPFSTLAVTAVATLAVTGAALSIQYIASPAAAIGTSYGAMVLTKVTLFAAMLALGVLNHRALHGSRTLVGRREPPNATEPLWSGRPSGLVLRRRLEVEAGLGIVVMFVAASIGAAPPAVDVGADRATLAEIRAVFTPQLPRLTAPSLAELAAASDLGNPFAPRSAEQTAWSEFGHHVAGLFIVSMGLLAIFERTGRAPWARHWPLLFIGLTAFVAYSLDPEGWQTGRVGFWKQLLDVEVLQHRILLAVTALLGLAEWRVRSGRNPDSPWRYVFPVAAVLSGTLLLSHAHEVSNAKSAFLMEVSHLPMGVVVLVAGWARWLELRLPPVDGRKAGRFWGPALLALGLLLLMYREE